MSFVVIGLGNPNEEYEHTRHNAGRDAVSAFRKAQDFPAWESKKAPAMQVSKGKLGKEAVILVLPDTFMNKSGLAAKAFVKSKKAAEKLIVVHDDVDLPFGKIKLVFGRGSGGHRGVESVQRSLGTKNYIRVRVGVAPTTPSGKIKKPRGEKAVLDFLMGNFTKKENEALKKVFEDGAAALNAIISDGRAAAMNRFNS